MSIKLVVLLVLCGACIAAPVQTKATASTSKVASQAASFTSLPKLGNVVIVGVISGSGAGALGEVLTDNQTNAYVRAAILPIQGTTQMSIWCGKVLTSSGTFTLTATEKGSTNFIAVMAAEYAGYTCNVEKFGTASGATSPYSCGSFTTVNASDLLISVLDMNSGSASTTFTAPTGYTTQMSFTDGTMSQTGAFADRVVTAVLTTTPTWASNQNVASSPCGIAAFMAISPTAGAFP